MNFKYAIFDMDGTLIDSMQEWSNLCYNYLKSFDFEFPSNVDEVVGKMTLEGAAEFFSLNYPINLPKEQIYNDMLSSMNYYYEKVFQLKPGVKDYLLYLHKNNIRMCVATGTNEKLATECFERLGINKLFEKVFSCETYNLTKNTPDIYLMAAKHMNAKPSETMVFEDAPFAATTAKKAGFQTVGVYDECFETDQNILKNICDRYIISFNELCKIKHFSNVY